MIRTPVTSPKIKTNKFFAITHELSTKLEEQTQYNLADLNGVVFSLLLLGKTEEQVCSLIIKARSAETVRAKKISNNVLLATALNAVIDVEELAIDQSGQE